MTVSVKGDWLTPQREASKELRKLLIDHDLTARMVAQQMGISDGHLSNSLACTQRWGADFEARFRKAVEDLSK